MAPENQGDPTHLFLSTITTLGLGTAGLRWCLLSLNQVTKTSLQHSQQQLASQPSPSITGRWPAKGSPSRSWVLSLSLMPDHILPFSFPGVWFTAHWPWRWQLALELYSHVSCKKIPPWWGRVDQVVLPFPQSEDIQKSKEVKSPKSQSKSSLMPSPSSSPKW